MATLLWPLSILGLAGCQTRHMNESAPKYGILPGIGASLSWALFRENLREIRVCVVDDGVQEGQPGRDATVVGAVRDALEPWRYLIDELPGFKNEGRPLTIAIRVHRSCRDRFHTAFKGTFYAVKPADRAWVDRDERQWQAEGLPPAQSNEVVIFIRGPRPLSIAYFGDKDRSYALMRLKAIALLSGTDVIAIDRKGEQVSEFTHTVTHEFGHLLGLADLYSFDGLGVLPGQHPSIMARSSVGPMSTDEFHGLRAIQVAITTGTAPKCAHPYVETYLTADDGVHAASATALFCAVNASGANEQQAGGFRIYSDVVWSQHRPETPPAPPNYDAWDVLSVSVDRVFRCDVPGPRPALITVRHDIPKNKLRLQLQATTILGRAVQNDTELNERSPVVGFVSYSPAGTLDDGAFEGQLVAYVRDGKPALGLHVWFRYAKAEGGGVKRVADNLIYRCD
jgi:hypothetical protein